MWILKGVFYYFFSKRLKKIRGVPKNRAKGGSSKIKFPVWVFPLPPLLVFELRTYWERCSNKSRSSCSYKSLALILFTQFQQSDCSHNSEFTLIQRNLLFTQFHVHTSTSSPPPRLSKKIEMRTPDGAKIAWSTVKEEFWVIFSRNFTS